MPASKLGLTLTRSFSYPLSASCSFALASLENIGIESCPFITKLLALIILPSGSSHHKREYIFSDPENNESIIGEVVSGEITNVTNFGAFVRLENGEEGLVHISEIANEFVTDINSFVSVGDAIKVKVLSRNNKSKLELSMKQTKEKKAEPALFLHKESKNSNFS